MGQNALHGDVFDPVTSLYTLGLRSNGLTTLHKDIFDELTELAELDLSCNAFTNLNSNRFDGPEDSLQYHDLARNPWSDREGRQSTFADKLTVELIITTEDDNDRVPLAVEREPDAKAKEHRASETTTELQRLVTTDDSSAEVDVSMIGLTA